MKEYKVTNIKYDTDGEDINLPTELVIFANDEDYIADAISDMTGFLVESFSLV